MAALARRTWKIIALCVSLFLILSLIITIVVMATVQISFLPTTRVAGRTVNAVDFSYTNGVEVFEGGTRVPGFPSIEDEIVRDFIPLFESSFRASFLRSSAVGARRNFRMEPTPTGTTIGSVAGDSVHTLVFRFDDAPRYVRHANGDYVYRLPNVPYRVRGVVISITENNRSFDRVHIYFMTQMGNYNLGLRMVTYANFRRLSDRVADFIALTDLNLITD